MWVNPILQTFRLDLVLLMEAKGRKDRAKVFSTFFRTSSTKFDSNVKHAIRGFWVRGHNYGNRSSNGQSRSGRKNFGYVAADSKGEDT
jgi:hypothetical protein